MMMRKALIVCSLLPILQGCEAPTTATPAPVTPTPPAPPHQFVMSQGQAGTFLVDAPYGSVWRLDKSGEQFVPVAVSAADAKLSGVSSEETDELKKLGWVPRK